MINIFLPSFIGLFIIQKDRKLNVLSYLFYYVLLNILTNTFVSFVLWKTGKSILKYNVFSFKYVILASILSIIFSYMIIMINKNIKLKIEKGDK